VLAGCEAGSVSEAARAADPAAARGRVRFRAPRPAPGAIPGAAAGGSGPDAIPGTAAGVVPGGGSGTGGFPGASSGFAGGGPGGADNAQIKAALAYAKTHGGGAVAVSSQSSASASIIESNADVVAIGGFSGRESQVSLRWFAQQVAAGKIRWVVATSLGGGVANDTRTGSQDVMSAVAKTCKAVTTSSGTMYDCQGSAAALAQLAS
jgi:hypothetical protein